MPEMHARSLPSGPHPGPIRYPARWLTPGLCDTVTPLGQEKIPHSIYYQSPILLFYLKIEKGCHRCHNSKGVRERGGTSLPCVVTNTL